MDSGNLRHWIELYEVTRTGDGQGGTIGVDSIYDSRYAAVRELSMSEAMRSGQVNGQLTYRITIRRTPGENLPRNLKVKWNDTMMNITSIVSDEFWHTLTTTAKK